MLSGAIGLQVHDEVNELLLTDPVSELGDNGEEYSGKILYTASFENLARSNVQYDTVIWVLISLLLVLAWGVGLLMLLCLPIRRYVLQKDISSRKLYVTSNEIVYKVTRPFFLPFLGITRLKKRIPLALVLDIIIEQGCLQSLYGLHTFRIESISRRKAAPMDELQLQGVSNPRRLRKVIMTEASKLIQVAGRGRRPSPYASEVEVAPSQNIPVAEGLVVGRSSSSTGWKMTDSPQHSLRGARGVLAGDLVLNKLEEVKQSVKRIESLIENSQP